MRTTSPLRTSAWSILIFSSQSRCQDLRAPTDVRHIQRPPIPRHIQNSFRRALAIDRGASPSTFPCVFNGLKHICGFGIAAKLQTHPRQLKQRAFWTIAKRGGGTEISVLESPADSRLPRGPERNGRALVRPTCEVRSLASERPRVPSSVKSVRHIQPTDGARCRWNAQPETGLQ